MWIDVVVVGLLLGGCAFLKRTGWHTRFLARVRTAGNSWVKAAHDAVTLIWLHRLVQRHPAAQLPRPGLAEFEEDNKIKKIA
jgi:hypothetical protein